MNSGRSALLQFGIALIFSCGSKIDLTVRGKDYEYPEPIGGRE
jgi:hypothetical protein